MTDVIPLFHTSASRTQGGIFTIEKAGAAKESGRVRGPVSLCDLAKDEGLKKLTIVASNFADFMMGFKNLGKVGCDMAFGLKIVVCDDIAAKDEPSIKSESKVVLFMKSDKAYHALINLYTKAATDGFYYVPRLDWKTLRYMWSDELILGLPFYSSFLAKNTLTFAAITPDLPVKPVLLREVGQEMPFDDLLNGAVDQYATASGAEVQPVKSIYYKRREDAKAWQVWRAILGRATYDSPQMEHCCSREFSYESFRELTA
jgi:DNA polymerase III alpha subunit